MAKRVLLGAAAVLLVIAAAYAAFFVAPEERTMGVLQRIFYFHVACAWAGLTAFMICFMANLLYVWKRQEKYDWLGGSCREVGTAFTTVFVMTGAIRAKPAWRVHSCVRRRKHRENSGQRFWGLHSGLGDLFWLLP